VNKPTLQIERTYMRLLRAYVNALQAAAFRVIAGRLDAREAVDIRVAMHDIPIPDTKTIASRVAKGASASFQRLTGITPLGAGSGPLIDHWRAVNVHLIRSIADDLLPEVTKILNTSEDIRGDLIERFDVTKSRADLIARDQTLKLNGQITEHLHTDAGITRYRWSTSHDDRVRPEHDELDGTEQEWANPPDTGNGQNHPGQDIQCRCVAIPIIED